LGERKSATLYNVSGTSVALNNTKIW